MAGPTTLFQTGVHASRPAASAGCVLYSCTDHSLVYRSDGSAWTTWMTIPAGASMATDSIWDAAGDLAVGTGADTAARLAKGAAGANLSTYNGVVAWNGGTSFPASPATGDRYWRSDLKGEYVYDGARWLSTVQYDDPMVPVINLPTGATATALRSSIARAGAVAIYLEEVWMSFFVSGGTALSGSHKWVVTIVESPSGTTRATLTIDSGASSAWRVLSSTGLALVVATTQFEFEAVATKTGTPGNLYYMPRLVYRLIGT